MLGRLALVIVTACCSCASDSKVARTGSPTSPSSTATGPSVGSAANALDSKPSAIAEQGFTPSLGSEDAGGHEISEHQEECEAKLAAMGLEHGNDSCKPKPPATPPADEVQDLPKVCVAESPRDKPCKSYGGTYTIRLEPDPAEPASCFGKTAIETTVRLKADTRYGDRRDLSYELGGLLRALKINDEAPSMGSTVRDGVCCIDIDAGEEANGTFKRVVIRLASGESVVSAEASIGCDDSGDRAPLKVQVTRK